jgi:hypothetical protein
MSAVYALRRPTAASCDGPRAWRAEAPDRGVGDGDRPVELGQILPDVAGVGQIVGHHDVIGVGRVVALARIGPVRFEEARGEQERLPGRVGEPPGGVLDDIFAVEFDTSNSEKPSFDGYDVSCCIPNSAVYQPDSNRM